MRVRACLRRMKCTRRPARHARARTPPATNPGPRVIHRLPYVTRTWHHAVKLKQWMRHRCRLAADDGIPARRRLRSLCSAWWVRQNDVSPNAFSYSVILDGRGLTAVLWKVNFVRINWQSAARCLHSQMMAAHGMDCPGEYLQDDRGHLNPATEPILEAATKFLWDDMKETLEAFCANHAHLFVGVDDSPGRNRAAETALRDALGIGPAAGPLGDPAGGGLGAFQSVKAPAVEGEQRLDWTQAHLDFQELFEHVLESFIQSQPFSQEISLLRARMHWTAAVGPIAERWRTQSWPCRTTITSSA